jgi:hypothetical protein
VRLTRQITISLVLGTVVTFAAVGFLTLWIVDRIDRQAAANVRTMLDGAGRATSSQLVRTTIDYGWWDEGYEAFLRGDTKWLRENMGSGAEDTGVADVVLVADNEGTLKHGWAAAGLPAPDQADFGPVIDAARLALEGVPLDPQGGRTFVERAAGGLMFAGAARLSPTHGSVPDVASLPVVILGTYITPERLQDYGGFYLVDDLAMVDAPPPGLDFSTVTDVRGDPLAYLAWSPPTPSRDVLLELAVPMAVALLLFTGIMLLIASRAHHLAQALAQAARKDYLTGLDNRRGSATSSPCRVSSPRSRAAASPPCVPISTTSSGSTTRSATAAATRSFARLPIGSATRSPRMPSACAWAETPISRCSSATTRPRSKRWPGRCSAS